MLKENSREHKLYAGLIVDINGYVDDCEKENMIDNLHELVNILSRVEPPVKPACETLIKQVREYLEPLSKTEVLSFIEDITVNHCIYCGDKNPCCQCQSS